MGQDLGGVPFEVFVQIPPQIVKPSEALRELATQIWPKLANTVNPVHLPVPISVCNCLQGGLHRQGPRLTLGSKWVGEHAACAFSAKILFSDLAKTG